MRYMMLMLLLVWPVISLADKMVCYSNGRVIYSGKVKDITYDDGLFYFKEAKTRKVVFVSGQCVAEIVI